MKKVLTYFNSFPGADQHDFEYYASLTCQQRLDISLQLMKPIYDAYPRFERVYRVAKQSKRPIRDRWRLSNKQLPNT